MSRFTAGDTRAEWAESVPDLVTDKIRLELHRKHQSAYIFYRRHKWGADCYCTSCLTRFQARLDTERITPKGEGLYDLALTIHHNDRINCPLCGANVTAKSEGYGRSKLWEWNHAAVWSAADDGNTVYIACGDIYGGFSRHEIGSRHLYPLTLDELEKSYGGAEWCYTWVIRLRPGEVKAVRVSYPYTVFRQNTVYSDDDLKEPWDYGGGLYSIHHYTEHHDLNVLESTFLRYAYAEFCKHCIDRTIKYMEYAAVYPSIEMLSKTGFFDIVEDIIDYGVHCKREIDLSGKKPAEIFKLDTNRAAALMRYVRENDRKYQHTNILAVIKMWRLMLRFNSKTTVADAEMFCMRINADMVVDVYRYIGTSCRMVKCDSLPLFEKYSRKIKLSPVKIADYLDRQSISIYLYKDYINECETLGYDLTDSIINRPRDFAAAHERTSSAVRATIIEQKETAEREKHKNYTEKIYPELQETFAYSDKKYSIVVPTCADEIIDEGRQQRNCVAGYAERHIKGAVTILFLRKTNAAGTSFGTLEIGGTKGGYYFRQAFAAGNKQLPSDAKKWLDKWLAMVNSKTAEKDKNRIAVTA